MGTTGYKTVTTNSPSALMNALAQQPVSVAVAASSSAFQLYKSGVLNSSGCGTALNHGVTAVGYGSQNGQNYFIIKNSWGAGWGEAGYIKLANNGQTGPGMCGVLSMMSYPTIA